MGSNVPVINESTNEMIYEMNHILNCRYEIKGSFEPTNDQHAYVCVPRWPPYDLALFIYYSSCSRYKFTLLLTPN